MRQIAELRIAIAGYRLADVLCDIARSRNF